jgi:hypothetical protein
MSIDLERNENVSSVNNVAPFLDEVNIGLGQLHSRTGNDTGKTHQSAPYTSQISFIT